MVSSFVIATIIKTAAHIADAASPETVATESLHVHHVASHTAPAAAPLRRRGIEMNNGYRKRHTLDNNQHGKENSSRQTTAKDVQLENDPFLGLAQQQNRRQLQ